MAPRHIQLSYQQAFQVVSTRPSYYKYTRHARSDKYLTKQKHNGVHKAVNIGNLDKYTRYILICFIYSVINKNGIIKEK